MSDGEPTNQMQLADTFVGFLKLADCEASEITTLDVLDALACSGLKLAEPDGPNDASIAYLLSLQPEDN